MRGARLFVVALTLLAVASASHGLTYVLVRDHHLAAQADLIVYGQVAESRPHLGDGPVSTSFDLAVDQVLKGRTDRSFLEFRVPGGKHPSGEYGLTIHGAPEFDSGQRVLMFLKQNADGSFRVLHINQGAFYEIKRGKKRYFARPLPEEYDTVLHDLEAESAQSMPDMARRAEPFLDYLRQPEYPAADLPDYIEILPAQERDELEAQFTLLRPIKQTGPRWFTWDSSITSSLQSQALTKITIKRSKKKQAGIPNTKAWAKAGANAWNKSKGVNTKYVIGGKTGSTSGFSARDGMNTILYKDFTNFIGADYQCGAGGTLGVGGPWWTSAGGQWKGRTFFGSVEAEVILNNGLGCLSDKAATMKSVLAHELGHTLGIGHACGDSKSPKCSSSSKLNSTLMNALVQKPPSPKLRQDDLEAGQYLYGTGDQVPCQLPPGHKNFCKKCGPCGTGQGKCSKNKQCASGLTCKSSSGTKVCT